MSHKSCGYDFDLFNCLIHTTSMNMGIKVNFTFYNENGKKVAVSL